jgi:hypothetical protein
MKNTHAIAFCLALCTCAPALALDGNNQPGAFGVIVPVQPLSMTQPVGNWTFTLPQSTGVLICTSFRWLVYPDSDWATANYHRVAFINLDGQDVGSLMINRALPPPLGLIQFSTGACYSATLPMGTHTYAMHFGALSNLPGKTFSVNGRITVAW